MDTVNGLPAHPLLVHFVVVLLPLTAVCAILGVVWPAARRKLGILTPVLALIALVLVPLTTDAGEALEKATPQSDLVEKHAELGDQALIWAAPLFVFAALWWALDNSWVKQRTSGVNSRVRAASTVVVGLVLLVVAIGSIVMVYRIGESGARAVWNG